MRRLLIRPGGIGDCITCFPALQHLKTSYTEVWIPTSVVPLVHFADRVCSLASSGIDLLAVGELPPPDNVIEKLSGFDQISSWYGAARPEFRRLLEALGPECHFFAALPPDGYPASAVDFYATQVGAPLGLAPRIAVSPPEPRNTVVIHPFSGGRRKNWPLECFQELASLLPLPVEWVAGPEEEVPGAHRFASLLELASWMRGARLYIGNDSGITHLATAIGIPVLALFGPSDPVIWAPQGATVMRSESLSALRPCAVLEKTRPLLESPAASSAGSVCAPP